MRRYIIIIALVLILFTGCGKDEIPKLDHNGAKNVDEFDKIEENIPNPEIIKEIAANELGRIMIIEYHVIGDKDARWARSYESFRQDLEKLYSSGYVAVSLKDMIKGNIDIPAGKTPVVITFDDGTQGQFRYIENEQGEMIVDPKSGVGVLENFYKEFPDFGLEATFFINYYTPFGQGTELSKKKITHIIESGMDIGNHSVNHLKMNTLSKEEVAKELALIVKMVKDIVPDYEVETLALPFGIGTKETEWSVRGEYEGTAFENIGVLLVGSTPAPSPYNKNFPPYALERVQVFEDNLDKWIKYFEDNPDQKYVSDGYAEVISFPESKKEILNTEIVKEKEIITY